ncbi:MAG: hypothetical protein M4579_000798 [Chaenotheca gracillima]|nr:MAG: hypothetical protein M4579_000798 [Chaenotheca gracillima]
MFGAFRHGSAAAGRAARFLSTNALRSSIPRVRQKVLSGELVAPVVALRQFQRQSRPPPQPVVVENIPQGDVPVETFKRFDELMERGLVNESIVKAITEDMGLSEMTEVQGMTLARTLGGSDMFAQARTGTGKTIAFLIPVLNNILKELPNLESRPTGSRRPRPELDIRSIIISPTRELAEQIAVEARRLTQRTGILVQTAVGGSGKREGLARMRYEGCHVLVATPGRLKDILTDGYSDISAPNLNSLVLDEGDRLLDQGFSVEIDEIVQTFPRISEKDRQTLMFSATIQKEVVHLVRRNMKPDYRFVNAVSGDQPTHERIPQKIVNVGALENLFPTILELCKREIAAIKAEADDVPFKAIVYLPSKAFVTLAASAFMNLRFDHGASPIHPARIYEIHSGLSQGQRTRAAERFRQAESAILFSSDVTARGMDFPNVTHIVQASLPQSPDDYVHRLGRTGRAGKPGQGWLLIPDVEMSNARKRLREFPIKKDTSLEVPKVDMSTPAHVSQETAACLTEMTKGLANVDRATKVSAWLTLLSTYCQSIGKHASIALLQNLSRFGWGWDKMPSVSPSIAQRLNLTESDGIEIGRRGMSGDSSFGDRSDRSDRSGGYGGRSSGGRGFGGRSSGGRSSGGRGFERDSDGPPRGSSNDFEGGRSGFSREPRGGRGGFSRDSRGGRGGSSRDSRDSRGGRGRDLAASF